ncbi:Pc04g00090 [Penicillium rubens Wisconsin 54-1255]|uniref:Pc04g00090 protein n=1 Tax=Penicillium rubens (strain ATCC 28089 / DSM 1075 / NRRL 1951 / Wisconsin 54-1255) TaxID=500485 RepID=B6GVT6_PENRW|nr:Pc04g00090 [Penicillium rubens Wisconsin 54-1255]
MIFNQTHYRIEWRVTVNNREVSKDTEEDVVLAPSAFWQLSLGKVLEKALRRKTAHHRQVRSDDTVIVASTTDRTKQNLSKRLDDTDISWTAIEKQLLICFNYVENRRSSPSAGRKGEKRGKSSVTQRLLSERDAQIDVEEISHVEKGGVLESHKDVPEAVRDELYREEQDRLERDRPKGGHVTGPRLSYPPINIHLSSSPSAPHGLEISAPKVPDNLQPPSPLDISSPRDVSVKEYGYWQVSNVENDSLKTVFREVCDVMLENGLDLEQVSLDVS